MWKRNIRTSSFAAARQGSTLDLTDDAEDGWGDGFSDYPRIRVYEGTNDLGTITVDATAAQYTIETYDKDAISLEWEVDDSWASNPQETNGYICEQILTLKEGSTTLFSLDTTGDPCGDDENETYSNGEKLYPSGTPNAAPSTGGTLTEVSQS